MPYCEKPKLRSILRTYFQKYLESHPDSISLTQIKVKKIGTFDPSPVIFCSGYSSNQHLLERRYPVTHFPYIR